MDDVNVRVLLVRDAVAEAKAIMQAAENQNRLLTYDERQRIESLMRRAVAPQEDEPQQAAPEAVAEELVRLATSAPCLICGRPADLPAESALFAVHGACIKANPNAVREIVQAFQTLGPVPTDEAAQRERWLVAADAWRQQQQG